MSHFTHHSIPDQTGRVIIVTGANSGLGYESAKALAPTGAQIIMAVRNTSKGQAARDAILKESPNAQLDLMTLDLGSLESVRQFADAFRAKYPRLDVLMNNAGVMAPPRQLTADGFEMQIGVNHLGHFALTGLLLDLLSAAEDGRVVNVSSIANYQGRIAFDDLMGEKQYTRYGAYGQSKLANVMFAFELNRRLRAAGNQHTRSIVAHPGLSRTNLQTTTAASSGNNAESGLYAVVMPLMAQSAADGALPQLYAATAPDAESGRFYGPRWFGVHGAPREVKANQAAYVEADTARLWDLSAELTGVTYSF